MKLQMTRGIFPDRNIHKIILGQFPISCTTLYLGHLRKTTHGIRAAVMDGEPKTWIDPDSSR